MVTLAELKQNTDIQHYLDRADEVMASVGFTEHGRRHASVVSKRARAVLQALDRPPRQCELAAIAAFIHDIGNIVNRDHHAQSGATLAHEILIRAGMSVEEIIEVVTAIGHHHETDGAPVSDIAAALIVADKSDVHRSRVRNKAMIELDIHDRVNFAVTYSALKVVGRRKEAEMEGERGPGNGSAPAGAKGTNEGEAATSDHASVTISEKQGVADKPSVTLALTIDTSIAPVMEYFEIFLPRMILSNRAADRLGAIYKLVINETHLL